jgi:hypothetical protein
LRPFAGDGGGGLLIEPEDGEEGARRRKPIPIGIPAALLLVSTSRGLHYYLRCLYNIRE